MRLLHINRIHGAIDGIQPSTNRAEGRLSFGDVLGLMVKDRQHSESVSEMIKQHRDKGNGVSETMRRRRPSPLPSMRLVSILFFGRKWMER